MHSNLSYIPEMKLFCINFKHNLQWNKCLFGFFLSLVFSWNSRFFRSLLHRLAEKKDNTQEKHQPSHGKAQYQKLTFDECLIWTWMGMRSCECTFNCTTIFFFYFFYFSLSHSLCLPFSSFTSHIFRIPFAIYSFNINTKYFNSI